MNRGFSIIELVISIGIFVIMTAVVVAKYGNFNQSALLTNTAYDIALAVRSAQTYGLSVKNAGTSGSINYNLPYGVSFSSVAASCGGTNNLNNTNMILFNDSNPVGTPDGTCSSGDSVINLYKLTRGATILRMCVGTDQSNCRANGSATKIDVSYRRPNPEASICAIVNSTSVCNQTYSEITIKDTSNDAANTRTVVVRQNGQISVEKQ